MSSLELLKIWRECDRQRVHPKVQETWWICGQKMFHDNLRLQLWRKKNTNSIILNKSDTRVSSSVCRCIRLSNEKGKRCTDTRKHFPNVKNKTIARQLDTNVGSWGFTLSSGSKTEKIKNAAGFKNVKPKNIQHRLSVRKMVVGVDDSQIHDVNVHRCWWVFRFFLHCSEKDSTHVLHKSSGKFCISYKHARKTFLAWLVDLK